MSKYDRIQTLNNEDFRRLTGVKKDTFNLMLKCLYKDLENKKKSGKPMKLCIEDRLLLALEYLRENRTFFHIAIDYDINKSTAIRICHWAEDILSKCEEFKLPSKKKILESDMDYEIFVVDATETPIERPKKRKYRNKRKIKNRKNNQKKYYSGKKKKHTIKTQIVINKKTRKIICTNFSEGKKHDFKLFKESKLAFKPNQTVLVDTGYTGILKIYQNNPNVLIPKKKSKKNPLTTEDKTNNINISKERIVVENVIGFIKRFRIIKDVYRCRRKRFGLRFNLIAGICNWEI